MDVAQLVRASDCGSEGRGFESRLPPQSRYTENTISIGFNNDLLIFLNTNFTDMKNNVFQYVVVIIAVVVWIISKMAKVTKPNTSTTPPVTPQQSKKLDDWWKELSQEMETQTAQKPAQTKNPQNAERKGIDNVNEDYFDKLHKNYKNAEFTLTRKPKKELEIIDDIDTANVLHKSLNINIKQQNEARRAFVYSEIFNNRHSDFSFSLN